MNRAKILGSASAALAALLLLPLRSDGGAPCDNATTSLQSTLNNPIAGDEKFFTLPIGPSNVMFLLDVSGSMGNIPQCGDAINGSGDPTWAGSGALTTCTFPTFGSFSAPSTAGTVNGDGTCAVSGDPDLKWMTSYKPTTTLVDAGHGTASNGLVDDPTWGKNCTGNSCLFQPDQVYVYGSWDETSAAPLTNGCQVTFTYADYDCTDKNNPRSVNRTFTGNLPNCTSCLTDSGASGFYFYKSWTAAYATNNVNNGRCTGTTTLRTKPGGGTATALFSGGWLNANPPKFMSARKAIKETAWIDPATTRATDQLRIGLSFFSTQITNGAAIVVPLGPSAANSFPVNPAAFVSARQLLIDALNHRNWPGGVTLPSLFTGGTPMATALFHLGQYFTQPGTYSTAFGSSYQLTAFDQSSAGLMQAPWASGEKSICWSCQKSAVILVTDGSPNSEMTFPAALTSYDDSVYKLTANCGAGTSCRTSPTSACCSPSDSTSNPPSRLPRVASWVHHNDLRPSDLTQSQTLTVNAISFNLPSGNAQQILQSTANMSAGTFNNAPDGTALAAAIAQAVSQVSNTATSFGSPAATSLTTINAVNTKAFITRFKPNQRATWEGHVFEWMLFDETAAGCNSAKQYDADDPTQQVQCPKQDGTFKTVNANFNGDRDSRGYNVCSGSFLLDGDCDEVVEDSTTGAWYKRGSGNTPAKVYWDAGQVLSTASATGYRSAAEHDDTGNVAPASRFAPGKTPRNIWTALPDGTVLELETKNAATLAPYMNLDQTWCSNMESFAKLCGTSPLPACPVTVSGDWKTYCAQQVILFARGWDVMNQDGDACAGPGNPSNGTASDSNALAGGGKGACILSGSGTGTASGEERDRANDAVPLTDTTAPSFYKLGDVFHSSPVLVQRPAPEDVCRLGVENQCVRTIFGFTSTEKYKGVQTDLDTYSIAGRDDRPDSLACGTTRTVDAYRAWRSGLKTAEAAVLVGSNDGFLHAFDAGGPDTSATTSRLDQDCVWLNATDGTGEELWAFLPPDLLPRLRDTLMNHQYMVDGNVMVRDVWVDGVAGSSDGRTSGSGNALDGKKQKNEFRTIAVFTERSGGTQFTALDVTNSFDTDRSHRPKPSLLWTFPPPRSDDAQYMGQSWSDFSPRPPPIGAVRLVPDAGDVDPQKKGWVEKWIVMINGGYDPTLNRGRAVWMVDAWKGSVYWRFTDSDFKANVVGSASNTTTSMFPVPAGVGLVDIGDPSTRTLDSDNFFDTATWGDMGGNLFVARFWDAGKRDGAGRVTNWKAARTFEQGRRADEAQYAGNRSEFFYMTANAYEPQRSALRTLVGSGNREQILEQGQTCGPDNVFSCCQAGCAVTATSKVDYGVCSSAGSFACSSTGQMTSGPLAEGCGASGAAQCTGGSSNTFNSTASYSLNCGTGASTSAGGSATCDANGLCSVSPVGSGHDVTPSNAGSCTNKARFYGIWSYGGIATGKKSFTTKDGADWSEARTFDQNRFTDVATFAGCTFTGRGNCSLVETTKAQVSANGAQSCAGGGAADSCSANVDDAGWFYQYNTGPCPTIAACQSGCTNEKTASGATVQNSCGLWNSFLPLGSSSGSNTDPCSKSNTAQQTAIGYASNYVSGAPDLSCKQGADLTQIYRGQQRSTIAPPASPMLRMGVSQNGQVYYSALQLDPGGSPNNTALGQRDLAASLYWVNVSREGHICRHKDGSACE